MAGTTLFDQVKAVWESSKSITTKSKPESIFMTSRFLSMNQEGFIAANDCNRVHKIPDWAALSLLKYSTPTRSAPRNKYPKKLVQNKKLSPKRKVALEMVCEKFNVSTFHGVQVMALLEAQGCRLGIN